jgi:hypothetical protein
MSPYGYRTIEVAALRYSRKYEDHIVPSTATNLAPHGNAKKRLEPGPKPKNLARYLHRDLQTDNLACERHLRFPQMCTICRNQLSVHNPSRIFWARRSSNIGGALYADGSGPHSWS